MNKTYPFSLLYREFPIYWLLESLNPLAPGVNGMDGLKKSANIIFYCNNWVFIYHEKMLDILLWVFISLKLHKFYFYSPLWSFCYFFSKKLI